LPPPAAVPRAMFPVIGLASPNFGARCDGEMLAGGMSSVSCFVVRDVPLYVAQPLVC